MKEANVWAFLWGTFQIVLTDVDPINMGGIIQCTGDPG